MRSKKKRSIDPKAEMPVSRWLEICVGMIGIQPDQFWNMSVNEIYIVIQGFAEYNGGKSSNPMDKEDLDKLMEMFPDN